MGELVRSMDWSSSPLGSLDGWPNSLRTTVSLALASNFPISIAWGPERVQIYNDGYWPICGAKHPSSMGQDFKECWLSAWPAIGDAFESAAAGRTAFLENQRMFLDRHGYLEETFFTFSFSPIRDESGQVAGLFHPVTEMTLQTLAERRLVVLREISDEAADALSVDTAASLIGRTLARHPLDVPFALLYLADGNGREYRLAAAAGLEPGVPAAPRALVLGADSVWPVAVAAARDAAVEIDRLEERLGPLGCGPYPESPRNAVILPISVAVVAQPLGFLIAGASPRRAFDATYRTFLAMLRETVTNALVNARSYEEERQRAEKLAELDRAKTTFFSNVSHEFRTPLTLMLGPLESLLNAAEQPREIRDELTVAHRNALRLLKLVNSLLDFSRIQSGRAEASYEATDLCELTEDLASNFRAACEEAGLELLVDCAPLPEPIYVDREMWEKIVLNLVSNAFKFTLEGRIGVTLRMVEEAAVLRVSDTGIGISKEDLPKIFERFHRGQARGRTHEGTGIGLSLVEELVQLHGGTIQAESEVGRRTTFTVRLPRGSAHLASERVEVPRTLASTATAAEAYVEEARRWLPRADEWITEAPAASDRTGPRPLVVLADDNADMRAYVTRILSPHFDVEAVADGVEALEAARRLRPDLVLTDVMMPNMDGMELLGRMRSDEALATVPVVMVSARAGEESRVEGLEGGADDYLVKPFSARELVARVRSQLELARSRRDHVELAARERRALEELELQKRHLASVFMQAPAPVAILRGRSHLVELVNPLACEILGRTEEQLLDRPLLEVVPELRGQVVVELMDRVLESGVAQIGKEAVVLIDSGGTGTPEEMHFDVVYTPCMTSRARRSAFSPSGSTSRNRSQPETACRACAWKRKPRVAPRTSSWRFSATSSGTRSLPS